MGSYAEYAAVPADRLVRIPQGELQARASAVFGMIAEGKLKLRIEHIYALADAPQAHRDLEGRKTTGKLLLLP